MPSSSDHFRTSSAVAGRFGTTCWSVVLGAREGAEVALAKLCQLYWQPLYAYIRRRGHAVHEAQDLTQAFFRHLFEHRSLRAVDESKGRFRSFLLISLKHFLDNEWHKSRALKRGGRQVVVSWDTLGTEEQESLRLSDPWTPDRVFARRWALSLLERVMSQLRLEFAAARKEELFQRLQAYLTDDQAARSYQEVAAELHLTVGAVKVMVHRLRRRYGCLLRAEIAKTVADPQQIDDEIRQLFSALT